MTGARLLIYGEAWRGSLPYSLRNGFAALGAETYLFDYERHFIDWGIWRRLEGYLNCSFPLRDLVMARISKAFVEAVNKVKPDYVLVCKGFHLRHESLKEIRDEVRCLAAWHHDDVFNARVSGPEAIESLQAYDVVFSPRASPIKEEYLSHGARSVEFLQFWYDPTVHYPISVLPDERSFWGDNLSIVGNWSPRREEVLGAVSDLGLKIWGGSWHHAKRAFRKADGVKVLYRRADNEDMSRVVGSSKISVSVLSHENRDKIALRTFEVPACGGFQLSERTDVILENLDEDREIACFTGNEELRDKARFYLGNERARIAIAKAGHERLKNSRHTHFDRARQMLECMEIRG